MLVHTPSNVNMPVPQFVEVDRIRRRIKRVEEELANNRADMHAHQPDRRAARRAEREYLFEKHARLLRQLDRLNAWTLEELIG